MNDNGTFWLPEGASSLAPAIDSLFYFVLWASIILFIGTMGAMVYFVWKYRRRDEAEMPEKVQENVLMEVSWVVVPAILVLVLFVWGFKTFIQIGTAPPESYQIQVTGQQWLWTFTYPNGTQTTNELHVPVGRPVELTMSSTDVIHSLFIPAFRTKFDVLPNRYTSLWFEATEEGEYQLYCTEYCGTQHSGMLATVIVESQGAFNEWVKTGGIDPTTMSPVEYGAALFEQQACNTCHSVDGSRLTGPTMQGLFGSTEELADGSTVQVDENYLRASILEPGTQIVAGFPNVMPASYSALSEDEVSALIAFIKSQQ